MWALFLLAGAAVLLFVPGILPDSILYVLMISSITPLIFSYRFHKKYIKYLCAFLLGFAYVSLHASFMRDTVIKSEYEGKDITLIGVVDSVPKLKTFKARTGKKIKLINFIFCVEVAGDKNGNQIENLKKIQLSWYNPVKKIEAGQRWRLITRLKKPFGFANEGGFDYEKMLFSKRVGARGYVKHGKHAELLPGSSIVTWNDILREKIITKLAAALPEDEFNGIIMAIATGYRPGISSEQWDGLLVSGTNHLVAISGLHIGLIAGLGFFIFNAVVSRTSYLRNRIAPLQVAAFAAIIFALVYSALAGFAIPTQRALITVGIFMGGYLFKRYTRAESILSSALGLVLLIDPLSVLMPGFWLSFAAVSIILITVRISGKVTGWRAKLWLWVKIQCAISVGLAPLTLLLFDRVSVIAPLVNFVAVPLFSMVIVPVIFIAVLLVFVLPQLAQLIFIAVQWLLDIFWLIIEFSSQLDFATVTCSKAATITISVTFLLIISSMLFRRRVLVVAIPLLPAMLLLLGEEMQPGEFTTTFLDVGQGSAVFIKTENHSLLYDTGPNRGINTGASVIVPYLIANGIDKLEKMVVSHADNDHAGGAKAIAGSIDVVEIIAGEDLANINQPVSKCAAGQTWNWDGVEFSILYPLNPIKERGNGKRKSGNDASCVLLIQSKYGSLLLTGDISKSAERKLVKYYKDKLDVDVVSVPHHGSKSSSSKAFVNKLNPDYAVVSSGYRNRYKFPKPEVVKTYANAGAAILNTADSGMITISITDKGLSESMQYRRENKRVWMAVVPE